MNEIKWTSDQQAVIDSRDENVLVAAAAGSGKTAILTERIVGILTDDKHPVDTDRILVLTFTRAAAAEMRSRIAEGIERKIAENPANQRWRQQKMLLANAQISTLDSFCSRLVRDHFDRLDIDAGFRIADEGELRILKKETAEDVLEGYYGAAGSSFIDFAEKYGIGTNDDNLIDMILAVYHMAQGSPWPDRWLDRCLKIYQDLSDPEKVQNVFEQEDKHFHQQVEEMKREMRQAINIAAMPDGPKNYLDKLKDNLQILEKLQQAEGHDSICHALQETDLGTLRGKKGSSDPAKKEQVQKIRNKIKDQLKEFQNGIYAMNTAQIASEMAYLLPSVAMIVQLVRDFSGRLMQEKKDRGILEYSDLSHLALKLLAEPSSGENGEIVSKPTDIARTLQKYYQAVICDEYQDCNNVQETLMDVLSAEQIGRYDRFMVGDMKQSIYRFRQAEAKLFKDKYDKYQIKEHCRTFDLNQNFRSRKSVLESVNFFFRRIMTEEAGQLNYDDNAALKEGAVFPVSPGERTENFTDLLLIDYDPDNSFVSDNNISQHELEAMAVAQEIRRITDPETGLTIKDPKTGTCRRAGCGDIAVLLRSVTGWGRDFTEVFSREGIPAAVQSASGFLDAWEIRMMKAMLAVIDNPYRDIEFAAVLHAPFIGFNADQMASIRSCLSKGSFYEAMLAWADTHSEDSRTAAFLNSLQKLRRDAQSLTLWELIREIYHFTFFDEYAAAMPGGKQRTEHLRLLESMAENFDNTGRTGLFRFVRYLDELEENGIEPTGSLKENSPSEDSVRVMTIHQSKGLEFPVVILAGCGSQFNKKDSQGRYILHADYGIGLNIINTERRRRKKSVYQEFLADRINNDNIAEEMRILYVAMTRAKEKLIITGSVKGMESSVSGWKERCSGPEEPLRPAIVRSASSYLDWLMPPLLQLDAGAPLLEAGGQTAIMKDDDWSRWFRIRVADASSVERGRAAEHAVHTMKKDSFEQKAAAQTPEPAARMVLDADAGWKYAYGNLRTIKSKYSISELKEAHIDELAEPAFQFQEPDMKKKQPSFMKDTGKKEEKAASGTDYGTAFHRLMELLPFRDADPDRAEEWIDGEIRKTAASGRLTPQQMKLINRRDVVRFLKTPMAARMIEADRRGELYRERPFVAAVPVSMVDDSISSDEEVIVQGVIDVWFREGNQLVLLDYKTDRVPAQQGEQILIQRYSVQIDYYRYALEQYTGEKVVQSCLYSVKLGRTIDLNP